MPMQQRFSPAWMTAKLKGLPSLSQAVRQLSASRASGAGSGTASSAEASGCGGSQALRRSHPIVWGISATRSLPWKQRLGYAKSALRLILPEAKAVGLPYVEITTDPDNIASRRVIEANAGILVERFIKPQQFGCKPGLRFRITFT